MEWVLAPSLYLGARRWMPKPHFAQLEQVEALGRAVERASLAFKIAKRAGQTPAELRPLKQALAEAQADYETVRKAIVKDGVYVWELPGGGGAVLRHKTGAKLHSTHATLEEAQEAAEKMT